MQTWDCNHTQTSLDGVHYWLRIYDLHSRRFDIVLYKTNTQ